MIQPEIIHSDTLDLNESHVKNVALLKKTQTSLRVSQQIQKKKKIFIPILGDFHLLEQVTSSFFQLVCLNEWHKISCTNCCDFLFFFRLLPKKKVTREFGEWPLFLWKALPALYGVFRTISKGVYTMPPTDLGRETRTTLTRGNAWQVHLWRFYKLRLKSIERNKPKVMQVSDENPVKERPHREAFDFSVSPGDLVSCNLMDFPFLFFQNSLSFSQIIL